MVLNLIPNTPIKNVMEMKRKVVSTAVAEHREPRSLLGGGGRVLTIEG